MDQKLDFYGPTILNLWSNNYESVAQKRKICGPAKKFSGSPESIYDPKKVSSSSIYFA